MSGLWINNKDIWFQWNLLQAKVQIPFHLKEYSFIDEINIINEIQEGNKSPSKPPDKYDKMLKMGVPKEAVQRQKILDGNITRPPPHHPPHHPPRPPPITCLPMKTNNKSHDIPKIKASDLQSVILKKGKPIQKQDLNYVQESDYSFCDQDPKY